MPSVEGQPITFACNAFTRSVPEELAPPFNYFWFIDGTRYRLNDSLPGGHRLGSTGRQLLVSGLTLKDSGRRYGCSVQEEHSDYESDRSEEKTVVVFPMTNFTLKDWLLFQSKNLASGISPKTSIFCTSQIVYIQASKGKFQLICKKLFILYLIHLISNTTSQNRCEFKRKILTT